MKYSEELIIELLKQGNEEAYRYIYDRHYVLLCYIANEYVGDSFTAETIVTDLIYHLWEIRASLHISSSLRSYLVQAVRYRSLNHLNLEHKRREVAFSSLASEDKFIISENYPLGTLLEKELEIEIHKAIDKLPQECKNVFEKSRFEDKKYEEIAQELSISVNTVKYHIKNALRSIRIDMSKYFTTLLFFCFIFFK